MRSNVFSNPHAVSGTGVAAVLAGAAAYATAPKVEPTTRPTVCIE
jgi:hypothetical protein